MASHGTIKTQTKLERLTPWLEPNGQQRTAAMDDALRALMEAKRLQKLSFKDLANIAKGEAQKFDKDIRTVKTKTTDDFRQEKLKEMTDKVESTLDKDAEKPGGNSGSGTSDEDEDDFDTLGAAPEYRVHARERD